ncbi:MAG: hypothetical protein Q6364_09130 [Candidatus Hermodarchaeota archaeon]|nr:hypothetical protein [Candidatus Hermodarchaeota archaeon]
MLGIFDRIKSWFTRKTKPSSPSPTTAPSPPAFDRPMSTPDVNSESVPVGALVTEADVLMQEHVQLEGERTRLRQEITVVDSQYAAGEIGAADRDRAYRTRLARAGSIRVRQMEIRSRLAEMGQEVPQEWGTIRIMR